MNQRLVSTQDAAGAGSWDWDIPTGHLEWSAKMFELFGLDERTTATSFDGWRSALHPADQEVAEQRIAAALETHTELNSEYHIILPDGQIRWISALGRGIYDEQDRPIRMSGICLDITDRKRVEAIIQHLSTFPQLNPNPVLEIDASGRITFVNPGAARTLEWLGLGDDARAFLPADMATILQELEHKREGGFQREVQVGSAIFAETIQVIPASDVVRIYAFDITERKQAETAQRASEEKYRLLFQNMVEGFAVYELLYDEQGQPVDWRVLEVNNAYTRHTGVTRDRIVGRRISELFPAAIPEYLPRFAQVVATQTPSNFETYAKAVNRYQRISTFPAGGHRFASTIEDITDRKRADEALCASEERLATMFRYSPDGIGIISVGKGTFLDINEAFTRMLGCSRSEVLGHTWQELNLVTESDAGDKISELLLEKGQLADYEFGFTTRQGNVITLLVSLVPITVSGESCILAIGRDITKRKESEDAVRRMQTELTLGIQERTVLEERQRLARELHDSVSQALYGISLGVNTALTLFDTDRPRVLEALNYALSLTHAGLTEMRALIFELRPESLEVEGLIVALTKQVEALRVRHGIEVALSLCDEPDAPLAAKETLYRIAQEALQNAVKHARADRLDVRLIRELEDLKLEACDNGVGFDPLAAYPGHLGLRSMRERAQRAGGSLDIVSAPGRGTQIRARIPFAVPAFAQAE